MIWGDISSKGKSLLHIHDTSVDSEAYISCLEESLLSFAKRDFGRKEWYFLQDGARCHTSKTTSSWLNDHTINFL